MPAALQTSFLTSFLLHRWPKFNACWEISDVWALKAPVRMHSVSISRIFEPLIDHISGTPSPGYLVGRLVVSSASVRCSGSEMHAVERRSSA